MSRTTKPLPKSSPDFTTLSDLPIGAKVVLQHSFTDDIVYGVVLSALGQWGCLLRRTDQYGNQWLSGNLDLDNEDYNIKEVNGRAMQ